MESLSDRPIIPYPVPILLTDSLHLPVRSSEDFFFRHGDGNIVVKAKWCDIIVSKVAKNVV